MLRVCPHSFLQVRACCINVPFPPGYQGRIVMGVGGVGINRQAALEVALGPGGIASLEFRDP